jgi:hypothetical protein
MTENTQNRAVKNKQHQNLNAQPIYQDYNLKNTLEEKDSEKL